MTIALEPKRKAKSVRNFRHNIDMNEVLHKGNTKNAIVIGVGLIDSKKAGLCRCQSVAS